MSALQHHCTELSSFCLHKHTDGSLSLKEEHSYFYQCQLQLLVTERLYCDFVVWALTGNIHVQRISIDHTFLQPLLQKAEKFFHVAIMP